MRVYRNASMDRLMARRSERLSQSNSVFDNYLTGFLNNRNYFNNFGNMGIFGNLGNSNSSNSSNPFDVLNTSSMQSAQYNMLYQAKQKFAAERIEKALESGDPLRGVSYDEYLSYYLQKNGSVDTNTRQFYLQDVKGDKAALRDKQWRTDKNYIIPKRLYDNPLITADRDAAIEKLAKNEKLEDWEQRLLDTVKSKNSDKK